MSVFGFGVRVRIRVAWLGETGYRQVMDRSLLNKCPFKPPVSLSKFFGQMHVSDLSILMHDV